MLGFPAHHQLSLLKLMCIESVMPSNHLIFCRSLLLLPSIFPSIRVLSNESVFCIRWPKYWSFSFSISPSNEYPGLISFRIDWFQIGTGVHQGCIWSSCLFNLYAAYIMRNAGWMKHKQESRLPGEISITSVMQMTPPYGRK